MDHDKIVTLIHQLTLSPARQINYSQQLSPTLLFSSDNPILAITVLSENKIATSYSSEIEFWNLTNNSRYHSITILSDSVVLLKTWEKHLISICRNAIIIWDTDSITPKQIKTILRRQNNILEFLMNDKIIEGELSKIIVTDFNNEFPQNYTLIGHTDVVNSAIILSNRLLASGSNDNTLRIWNLDKRECIKNLNTKTNIKTLTELPNGILASGGDDGTIQFWDLNLYNCISILNETNLQILHALPDGNLLVVFIKNNYQVKRYNFLDMRLKQILDISEQKQIFDIKDTANTHSSQQKINKLRAKNRKLRADIQGLQFFQAKSTDIKDPSQKNPGENLIEDLITKNEQLESICLNLLSDSDSSTNKNESNLKMLNEELVKENLLLRQEMSGLKVLYQFALNIVNQNPELYSTNTKFNLTLKKLLEIEGFSPNTETSQQNSDQKQPETSLEKTNPYYQSTSTQDDTPAYNDVTQNSCWNNPR